MRVICNINIFPTRSSPLIDCDAKKAGPVSDMAGLIFGRLRSRWVQHHLPSTMARCEDAQSQLQLSLSIEELGKQGVFRSVINFARRSPKLWLRLWFVYTLVAFLGVTTLFVVSNMIFEQARHAHAYSISNLDRFLEDEVLNEQWQVKPGQVEPGQNRVSDQALAEASLGRLLLLKAPEDRSEGSVLVRASSPEASVQIIDRAGLVAVEAQSDGWSLESFAEEPLTAIKPIPDTGLDLQVQLHSPLQFTRLSLTSFVLMLTNSLGPLLISTVLGLLCGIVSARYITRRLALMDDATTAWTQGDFVPKIALASGDELGIHAERLNAMSRELESYLEVKQSLAVSNERTRIARDLHDTVKQNLFALGLQLASLRDRLERADALDKTKDENLAEAEQINREAQQDLIEIIAQLRTSEEIGASLGERLQSYANRLSQKLGIAVAAQVKSHLAVAPQIEADLLATIGELVTNSVRHGSAGNVSIMLDCNQDAAQIAIIDNGSGFDPGAPTNGIGLKSAAERIEALPSGKFKITSQAGAGARADIEWSRKDG